MSLSAALHWAIQKKQERLSLACVLIPIQNGCAVLPPSRGGCYPRYLWLPTSYPGHQGGFSGRQIVHPHSCWRVPSGIVKIQGQLVSRGNPIWRHEGRLTGRRQRECLQGVLEHSQLCLSHLLLALTHAWSSIGITTHINVEYFHTCILQSLHGY